MSKKKNTTENTRLQSIRDLKDSIGEEESTKNEMQWELDNIDDEEEETDQKGFDRTVD
jgi:hypothetical protein